MSLIGLNRIAPEIRERLLNRKKNPKQYIYFSPVSPIDAVNEELHPDLLTLTKNLNVYNSTDGYDGNVRRGNYSKQWYKRGDEPIIPNIYDNIENPDKRLLEKWDNPNTKEYNNYLDYINNILGTPKSLINVLGGIVTGDGVSLSLGDNGVGVVSNFDIQKSLLGRLYSTVSGKETELGKFGTKAAAISLANRTIERTQRRVVNQGAEWLKGQLTFWDKSDDKEFLLSKSITNKPGSLDDVFSMLTGDSATATSSNNGKYIELPESATLINDNEKTLSFPNLSDFLNRKADITSHNRRGINQELIKWTGGVNAKEIEKQVDRNKFSPNYSGNVSLDYIQSLGIVLDGVTVKANKNEFNGYNKSWQEPADNTFQNNGIYTPNNSEISTYYGADRQYSGINDLTNLSEDSLLKKTQNLFNHNKIQTIVSGFGKKEDKETFTQSAAHSKFGISKGRNLLTKDAWENGNSTNRNGYDDPYCRVWTHHHQYRKLDNLIRPFMKEDGETPVELKELHNKVNFIRPYLDNFVNNTVLQDNGFVKIAPHSSDWKNSELQSNRFSSDDPHRYMFSIENLAWKDVLLEDYLAPSQIGPNGGRLMWFAPYNLKFTEAVNVRINEEEFIGRGEPVYTYVNTSRTGNLSFTLIIDHSSFTDYMKYSGVGNNEDDEQLLHRFNAGCDLPENFENKNSVGLENNPLNANTPTPPTNPQKTGLGPDGEPIEPVTIEKIPENTTTITRIHFPNDYSGVDIPTGLDAIEYIYAGKGQNLKGGTGYERGNTNSSLSSYNKTELKIDNTTPKNIKWQENLSNQNKRVKIQNNKYTIDNVDLSQYKTITDKIVPTYSSKKIGTDDYLPRIRYKALYSYWDLSNYGLNTQQFEGGYSFEKFFEIITSLQSPTNSELKKLVDIFQKAQKVYITGYANEDGYQKDNGILANERAKTVFRFIKEKLGSLITDFNNTSKWIVQPVKKPLPSTKSPVISSSGKESKEGRYVDIKVVLSQPKAENLEDTKQFNEADNTIKANTVKEDYKEKVYNTGVTYKVKSGRGRLRYDEERNFFRALTSADDLVMNQIKNKLDFFVPAFHSTSPEGFNARLGFLHQCTRQGPTNSATDNNLNTATNLSFGRPPVCVLRVGDFYHTRIFIDSLNIDFDNNGVKWDLNPEGAGVQPMLANVNISFKFMGGQDLSGAISRLQNAVTFNYYANQSVYDDRADFIYNRTQKGTQLTSQYYGTTTSGSTVSDNYYELYDPFNKDHGNIPNAYK